MAMTFTTPDLSDEFGDELRVLEPVFTRFGGTESFHGEVVTVSCFEDNSRVKELVGTPGLGRVIVVDGGGSVRQALLGDQLAANAVDNDWAGLVINGAVRDVEILRELPLGVLALAAIPVRTEKLGVGDVDVPVTITGVAIVPGDHVYADANGIVVATRALLS